MQAVGEAFGVAHESGGGGSSLTQTSTRSPAGWPLDGTRPHLGEKLLVNALRGAAQRNFPEWPSIRPREEVL